MTQIVEAIFSMVGNQKGNYSNSTWGSDDVIIMTYRLDTEL